jgi:hypothetical protein
MKIKTVKKLFLLAMLTVLLAGCLSYNNPLGEVYPSTLASYLSKLRKNKVTSPYSITLIVNSAEEFDTIRISLKEEPTKYVCLDLSGSTVTSIPANAFGSIYNSSFRSNCATLTGIIIPKSVTSIGKEAFYYCINLTNVTISDSVTSIGEEAFYQCTSLANVNIPNNVTDIDKKAFYKCTSLSAINIFSGNSVYASEDGVLYSNDKKTLITYPVGKASTSFTIPYGVTSIADIAFYGCTNIANVILPNSVFSIGDSSFFECTSLINATIPDSVTSIGDSAFSQCNSLTSVFIPSSVTNIGVGAFSKCDSLPTINVTSGNSVYTSEDGILYSKDKKTLVAYPTGKIATSFTIPYGVASIGDSAFDYCDFFTNVTIPDSVISIGNSSFSGCRRLSSVIIPNGVTIIGQGAFFGCYRLSSVTLPDSLTSIGHGAFMLCFNLSNVNIPKSVTNISIWAFQYSGLISVTFQGTIPSTGFDYYLKDTPFPGDLRDKFYATNKENGTPGTYTREKDSEIWTRL